MKNEKKFFYVDNVSGEVAGPHTIKKLKELELTNNISSDSQVTEEGTENWLPFNEVFRSESLKFFEAESEKEEERKMETEREEVAEKERENPFLLKMEKERDKVAEKLRENRYILSVIKSIQVLLIALILITAISFGYTFSFGTFRSV